MKKKFLVFLFVAMIYFPTNVLAFDLSCNPGQYVQGDEITCYFKLGDEFINQEFDAFKGTIKSTDNLECNIASLPGSFLDVTPDNKLDVNFTGLTPTQISISLLCKVIKDEENSQSQVFIKDFEYHILDDITPIRKEDVSSDYITVITKEKKGESQRETKPRNTNIPDSRLKSIKEDQLNFTFSTFVTEYKMEVLYEVEKLKFDIVTQNPDATYIVKKNDTPTSNELDLSLGENIIDVFVTSPDGTSITCYTLTITRLARGVEIYDEGKDASLKYLEVKGYDIKFDKSIKEYTVHLPADVSNIVVNAKATSSLATVSVHNSDKLENGSVVSIEIKSGDESVVEIYKINITKDAPKKDYSNIIYTVIIILAVIVVVILFVLVAQKRQKNDPLLSIKHSKRKMNKGKKFDASQVAEVGAESKKIENTIDPSSVLSAQEIVNQNNNVQTEDVAIVTDKIVDTTTENLEQQAPAEEKVVETVTPPAPQVQPAVVIEKQQAPIVQNTSAEESAMPVMPVAPAIPIQPEEPAFVSNENSGIPQIQNENLDVPALPADMQIPSNPVDNTGQINQ